MSYQIIPNVIFILAVLGIILMILRRLPEAGEKAAASVDSQPGSALKAKGLPVETLSKIKTVLRFWLKKIWNFILEAKDLRQHSVMGYKVKKILGYNGGTRKLPVAIDGLAQTQAKDEQYYLDIIKNEPKNLPHYDELGKFYISHQNFSDAKETYLYMTSHQPTNPDTQARLAFCYYQLKNYVRAAEAYKKSLALDSTQPSRYYNLGLCLEAFGQEAQAAENFQKAVALEPSVKYYLGLSNAYLKLGNFYKARQALSEAQAKEPNNETIKARLEKIPV